MKARLTKRAGALMWRSIGIDHWQFCFWSDLGGLFVIKENHNFVMSKQMDTTVVGLVMNIGM